MTLPRKLDLRKSINRRGLSLMEVIVAIAILGGAMAVISNMISLGTRSSIFARWLSDAQIVADAKLAEISAGALGLDSVSSAPVEENPDWVYSVLVENAEIPGLLKVTVVVEPDPSKTAFRQNVTLSRFVPDPDYEPEQSVVQ